MCNDVTKDKEKENENTLKKSGDEAANNEKDNVGGIKGKK